MERNIDIGSGIWMPVDFDRMHNHTACIEHIENIGARNVFMDLHASVKRDDFASDQEWRAAKLAKAIVKRDAMYLGTLRVKVAGGAIRAPKDPIGAEAHKMARVFVYGDEASKGYEKGDARALAWIESVRVAMGMPEDSTQKAILDAAIERRANRVDVREAAAEVIAAKAKIVVTAEDLGI